MMARARLGLAALAAAIVTSVTPGAAQTFPNRPIHFIVAYSPGGTGDFVARVLADKIGAALGQSVVVENRAGASGAVGAKAVIASPADGHTLLVGQTAEVSINQHWLKGIGYDPDKDLQPIALAAVVPLALVVPGNVPYDTIEGMVEAFHAPGKTFSFASAGTGTPGHFAGELLRAKTGSNITHIPYKGAGPALNDLLGGHVDLYFPGMPAVMPQVKAGKLKMLAVSSAKRSSIEPSIRSVAEATGIANFDFTLWAGFFAPRATPPDVVARLNSEINKALADPEIKAKLNEAGAEVTPMSVAEFTRFVQSESAKYIQIIKETGVKAE